MNFNTEYNARIKKIDEFIENYIDSVSDTQELIRESMKYSVLNGGKRLRSILCIEIAKVQNVDEEVALKFAAAIEFIHAYSLVHDDLPCMDDDDMRRGKPSCHKKYGEAIAVLTGDALLTLAFSIMSEACLLCENPVNAVKAVKYVAKKAGMCGMINGQVIDINNENNTSADLNLLLKLVEKKTSELISAAIVAPVIISGADDATVEFYEDFADNLGIAFQIRDDFEDTAQDGKDDGSPNFINILGKENALKYIKEYIKKTDDAITQIKNNKFIAQMSDYLFKSFK